MRACRDDELPLPFQSWIDRQTSLGEDVRLLPRAINPGYELLALSSALISFGGMSSFLGYFLWRWRDAGGGVVSQAGIAIVALALLAVPWSLGRRWLRTRAATVEQRQGRLRQGILLSPEGMLVRLEPNRCYPITWDRYREATRFSISHHTNFQIQTLDGPVNFPTGSLRATLQGLEAAIEQVRPVAVRPPVVPRSERKDRIEHGPRRRLLRLVAFFLCGGVVLLGSLCGVLSSADESAVHDWSALGVFLGLVLMLAAVPYAFWTFIRLNTFDCPECGERLPRADEARPQVVFYCARCGINWNTLMREGKMPRRVGRG